MSRRRVAAAISGAFLLAVGLMLAVTPAQAGSWISSPSGVSQGETTEIRGGEFPFFGQVVLEVADPSGIATLHVVQADAEGNFSFQLQLDLAGNYSVRAWSSGGPVSGESPLAETIVAALGR